MVLRRSLFSLVLLAAGSVLAQEAEPRLREAEPLREQAGPSRQEAEPQRRPAARRPRGEDLNSAYMGGGMVQQAPFSPAPVERPAVERAPMP